MSHTHSEPAALPRQQPPQPGLLAQTLLRLFAHAATVTHVQALSPHFRVVTLGIDKLHSARWSPGDKAQISFDGGLSTRTFTPFEWNHRSGQLDLLGHLHGHGNTPAAQWLATAQPGDRCQLFGPRRSLALATLDGPALCVGDETSFALALALLPRAQPTRFLFEVTDLVEARAVLGPLGLGDADLVERQPGDTHLPELASVLLETAETLALRRFVVSGKATSIQHLLRAMKQRGLQRTQLLSKAYWAPGKTGLD